MPSFRHCQLNITIPNKQNTATEQDSFVKKEEKNIYVEVNTIFTVGILILFTLINEEIHESKKKRFFGIFHREKNDFELINKI